MKKYKNKLTINQRGGSLSIDNTTDKESVNISQRSGSNIKLTNVVNSELATNNKQTNVVNDSFETVGKNKNVFVGGDSVERVSGSSYHYKGLASQSEIDAYNQWRDSYREVADTKSKFKIKRGGNSFPNGIETPMEGERMDNPVVGSKVFSVENKFTGYNGLPERKKELDDVTDYTKVPDRNNTEGGKERDVTKEDVEKSAGSSGSNAPGVMEFGAEKSSATEGGEWEKDEDAENLDKIILEKQQELFPFEQEMGDGGDNTDYVKRDNFRQVGTVFNDYPSVKIDPKGRSQPLEMLVSDTGTYKNHEYMPHVEDVDNSSNFPGGTDSEFICNHKNTVIGSGGWNVKTSGPIEMGSTTFKLGGKKVHISGSEGVHIGSENGVELQSLKTITLRTNRQVYVESALGVKNNLVVGGGSYVEGETYLQHVTAPLEVQQTEDTLLFGQFATDENRKLPIGECNVGGVWYPVYALANPNLIQNYPHSHHFNNLPLRLTESNSDVRKMAQSENINTHDNISQSLPQMHERKVAKKAD